MKRRFARMSLAAAGMGLALLMISSDLSATEYPFGPPEHPRLLNTDATTDSGADRYPQVVMWRDPEGRTWAVAVWDSNEDLPCDGGSTGTDYDIFYSKYSFGTWSDPAPVNTNAATDSGDDVLPQAALNDPSNPGYLMIVWESHENLNGAGSDLDLFWSTMSLKGAGAAPDFKATDPAFLNSNAATDSGDDHNVRIVCEGPGDCIAVWESNEDLGGTAGVDDDILYSVRKSPSDWTAPAPLNSSATTDSAVEDDLAPEIAYSNGNFVCLWRSNWDAADFGSDFDIFFSRSDDLGVTWSPIHLLCGSLAETEAEQDQRPRIAVHFDEIMAVWSNGSNEIRASKSSDSGVSWTDYFLVQPPAKSGDRTLVRRTPSIATDGDQWVVAWSESNNTSGGDRDIQSSTSFDFGSTWHDLRYFADNAATDLEDDLSPVVVTDGDGEWMALWFSTEDLDGAGIDADIFLVWGGQIFANGFESANTLGWSSTAP